MTEIRPAALAVWVAHGRFVPTSIAAYWPLQEGGRLRPVYQPVFHPRALADIVRGQVRQIVLSGPMAKGFAL